MRTVWVTGGGKGIGATIALAFGTRGMRVAVSARTRSEIENVAEQIRAAGGEAMAVTCDVTQPEAVAKATAQIQEELGAITILVNNAGVGGSHKLIGHDDALWHKILDTNLNSVYYVTKAVAPTMVKENWGRIINIASVASKVGSKYTAAYTTSKHGVLGLTRALAMEFSGNNITVNAICPAYVDTPMTDGTIANMQARTRMSEAEARSFLEKLTPQNRLIAPEEVAHVALMLAADEARGITGQAINVDGGMVMF